MPSPFDRTDPLRRLKIVEDKVKKLREAVYNAGGFAPISASVYDGFNPDTDPVGEQFDVTFKVSDAGVVGDTGEIGQASDGTIPPNFARRWLRYVWYDDGFSADTGLFIIPDDGIYAVHGRMAFSVVNGLAANCNLQIRTGSGTSVDIAATDGPRDVAPGDSDVLLNVEGQAFLTAGTEVRMVLSIELTGLTGLSSGTDLITIPRASRASAPPADAADPNHDARFSITKISDTVA